MSNQLPMNRHDERQNGPSESTKHGGQYDCGDNTLTSEVNNVVDLDLVSS